MGMVLDKSILKKIRMEWERAPRGSKSAVVRKWAGEVGVGYSTIYRRLPKQRHRNGWDGSISNFKNIIAILAEIKANPPALSTSQAIRIAIEKRLVPTDIEKVSISSVNNWIKRLKNTK